MDVELSEIRSFWVLAGTLHFGRASEQLFLSQPALSKKIRRLEDKVKARLFTRTRRKVALTEAGRVLLTKAGKLLQDAESALARDRLFPYFTSMSVASRFSSVVSKRSTYSCTRRSSPQRQ